MTTWGNQHCHDDAFTKWMEIVPIKRATTQLTVMQLYNVAFYQWKIPNEAVLRASHARVLHSLMNKAEIPNSSTCTFPKFWTGRVHQQNDQGSCLKISAKAGNKNWDEGLSSILIGICSLRLWLEENWKQTNRKTHNNASYKQSSQLNGNHELLTDHWLEKLQSNLAGINQGIGDRLESDCEWINKQRIVTNRNTRGKQEIFFIFFFRNLHKKHIFLYKWDGSSTLVSRANPALYLVEINPKWK